MGKKVYKSTAEHGYDYAKCLKTNSFSNEGFDFIAKYNNYENEWEIEKAALKKDASIADKRFINLVLYATWRERRCFHLDPIEGGHRKVGIIQASFCTQYNFETGLIINPTTLEPQHFEDSGLFPKDPEVKQSDIQHRILRDYFQLVEDAENNNGFFCESQTVRVRFLKTWNINVPTFLQSCCTVSTMHSKKNTSIGSQRPFR